MTWVLFDKDGNQLKVGDEVATFREEQVKIDGIYPPGTSAGGRGGRVQLRSLDGSKLSSLFFPGVIRATFKEFDDSNSSETGIVEDDLDAPKSSPRYQRAMAREKGYDD